MGPESGEEMIIIVHPNKKSKESPHEFCVCVLFMYQCIEYVL